MSEVAGQYSVSLTLTGLTTGAAEKVRAEIEAALSREVPDASITNVSVTEYPPKDAGPWIEERITPLTVLFGALPEPLRSPAILAALADHYHRELSCLWRSVQNGRCVQGVIELRSWRQAGRQWICELESYDRGAPAGNTFNWHGHNTSQWQNQETGWTGHQGAIVLDNETGQISAHH